MKKTARSIRIRLTDAGQTEERNHPVNPTFFFKFIYFIYTTDLPYLHISI